MVDTSTAPPEEPDLTGSVAPGATFEWNRTAGTGVDVDGVVDDPCQDDDPTRRCEDLLLEVTASAAGTYTLVVELGEFGPVPEPATDIDLYVDESDELGMVGSRVAHSWNGALSQVIAGQTEPMGERAEVEVTFTAEQPTRHYLVQAAY